MDLLVLRLHDDMGKRKQHDRANAFRLLGHARKKRDECQVLMETRAMLLEERTRAIMLEDKIRTVAEEAKRNAVANTKAKLDAKSADFEVPGLHFMS